MADTMHERDVAATDEMIRNLRAGTFRKVATGIGAAGGLLMLGAAILIGAWKQGNDPEAFKEALRHMPPLNVTVTLDPNSTVKLAEGATVRLEQPSVMPRAASAQAGGNDPAIQTTVTVFKEVKHGNHSVQTGWDFPNGAAKKPERQFCHFRKVTVDGIWGVEDIGRNGVMLPAPAGVTDQKERFAKCQWFDGDPATRFRNQPSSKFTSAPARTPAPPVIPGCAPASPAMPVTSTAIMTASHASSISHRADAGDAVASLGRR
jgi:hypothetical protein